MRTNFMDLIRKKNTKYHFSVPPFQDFFVKIHHNTMAQPTHTVPTDIAATGSTPVAGAKEM